MVGKQLLKQNQKMYIVDLGLRRHLLARREYDLGYSLENTVFLELIRRGYTVNGGKIGSTEIDFVARKNDNYPKTILTLDRFTLGDYEEIEVINALDWLLKLSHKVI